MRRRVLPVFLALVPVIVGQAAFAQQWNGYGGQQQFGGQGGNQQVQQHQQFQPQMTAPMSASVPMSMSNPQTGFMPSQFQQAQAQQFQPQTPPQQQQPAQQFAPYMQGTAGEPGVDILDESLKYHNLGAQNPGLNRHLNQGQIGFSAGNQSANSNAGSPNSTNPNASLMSKPLFGSAGLFGTAGGGAPAGTGSGGSGINTQAVGAMGAAALLGTFLTNGGVGGMMKSVGWDNSRHMRGAVAGQ